MFVPQPGIRMVDGRQPRFGQAVTGLTLLASFVAGWRPGVPVMCAVLAGASLLGSRGNLYAHAFGWVKRALRLGPPREVEEAAPPRFANAVGSAFLGVASVLLALHLDAAAWTLALIVSALALLAATTGFCVGCEAYVLIRRLATRGRLPRRITAVTGD